MRRLSVSAALVLLSKRVEMSSDLSCQVLSNVGRVAVQSGSLYGMGD